MVGLAEKNCDAVAVAVPLRKQEVVPDIDIVGSWLGVTDIKAVCVGVAVGGICMAVTVRDALCELEAS